MASKADTNAGGPQVLTTQQVATLLQRTPRFVQQLAKSGYIEQSGRNQFSLVAVMRGVMAYYEERLQKSNKAVAANKASEARTKQIEQQMEIRQRNLVPRADFYTAQDFVIAKQRAALSGLPARVTRDLDLREKIEAEIDHALRRTAEDIERAAHALEEGGAVLETLGEATSGSVGGEE